MDKGYEIRGMELQSGELISDIGNEATLINISTGAKMFYL